MSSESEFDMQRGQKLSSTIIGTIMALIAIFAPIMIVINQYEWETNIVVAAMTWQANYFTWGSNIYFDPFILISSLPFAFLRIIFVIMIVRLYQGRTTKRRTLLVGIASELQLVALYYSVILLGILIAPRGFSIYQYMIPIPILLFVGFLIIHLYPPRVKTMWIEEVESRSWWDKPQEEGTEESKPEETKRKPSKEPESPW